MHYGDLHFCFRFPALNWSPILPYIVWILVFSKWLITWIDYITYFLILTVSRIMHFWYSCIQINGAIEITVQTIILNSGSYISIHVKSCRGETRPPEMHWSAVKCSCNYFLVFFHISFIFFPFASKESLGERQWLMYRALLFKGNLESLHVGN